MLSRIITRVVLWDLRKKAERLAREIATLYAECKAENPNAYDSEVVKRVASKVLDEEQVPNLPEHLRKRVEICCETVQGLCYLLALDFGSLKHLMNFRSLQFTHYMDKALQSHGFPPQSKEQKERILEAMELRLDGWEEWSGDL